MRAGALREQIAIQTATEAADSFGQAVKTWATVDTVRATVKPISGSEAETGGKTESRPVIQFTIRYTSLINEKSRIVWNSENYQISEVIDSMARNRMLIIKAYKHE